MTSPASIPPIKVGDEDSQRKAEYMVKLGGIAMAKHQTVSMQTINSTKGERWVQCSIWRFLVTLNRWPELLPPPSPPPAPARGRGSSPEGGGGEVGTRWGPFA
ncbi:hypothetical protein MUK42_34202 [Musa troglodytarum]|uniref:Uncharacterized protein n=1 Tax=Musa troglodytarum TaxID=320322 RepID=A0A9E7J974_9LILI|nr:hypothetical protein MUK42_34202 [Musa troglodytarum]